MSNNSCERVVDLQNGYKYLYSDAHFGMTTDAVLLADFCCPRDGDRTADLGAGGGILALLLCARAAVTVDAVEIQGEMCGWIKKNAAINGFEDRLFAHNLDLRDLSALTAGGYDLVVCNPPYKQEGSGLGARSEQRDCALHERCCTLSDVIAAGMRLLRFSGSMYLCQRPQRLCDVICLARTHGGEVKRLRMVHPYVDARPSLALIEIRRGCHPELTTEPPLILYSEKNRPSQEYVRIYGREGA